MPVNAGAAGPFPTAAPAAPDTVRRVTVTTLRFRPADVPCTDVPLLTYGLQSAAAHGGTSGRIAQEILDRIGELGTDATGIHRYLLDQRTRVRREAPWLRGDVDAALKWVRRHSTIYSERSCDCLRAAYRAWIADVEAALDPLTTPVTADVAARWAVSDGPLLYHDVGEKLAFIHLQDRLELQLTKIGRYREIAVDIGDDGGWPVVTVTRVGGRASAAQLPAGQRRPRNKVVLRFVPLTVEQSRAADAIRYGEKTLQVAGSWVHTWPAPLVTLIAAHPRYGDDAERRPQRWALTLVKLGFLDLSPLAQHVTARLNPGWSGTAAELLATARAVADADAA